MIPAFKDAHKKVDKKAKNLKRVLNKLAKENSMKTAEQIAEEVANEVMVGMQDRDDIKRITSALHEYGEAVRQRAAEVCRGKELYVDPDHCADAIERMELP